MAAASTPPAASASPSPLRALPVPDAEPAALRLARPQPDEEPVTQGALALRLEVDDEPVDPHFGPQRTHVDGLPDPAATATALVQALVEVLAGIRPVAQLTRWLAPDVLAGVHRRATLATRMRRGVTPVHRHAVVRSVRTCRAADHVVEASAVVLAPDRVRAVALRLEGLDGRWRVTALEIG